MRTLKSTWIPTLALLLLIAGFAACEGGDGTSSSDESAFSYGGFALESDDGNFTEESSTEPFEQVDGEDMSALLDDSDEEDVANDTTLNPEDEIDPATGQPTVPEIEAVYMVRLIWGQPFPNPLTPAVTDWSGTITATGAGLKVARVLRFERATGDTLSRVDRSSIEVVSTTKPHNDGLLLQVIQPVAADTSAAAAATEAPAAPSLSIDLGPVSLTYDVAALAGMTDVQLVDDMGNLVFVQAYEVRREVCARGFVEGYWKRLHRRGGVFGGRWINQDGVSGGRIAGIWGRRLNGHRVLFGVYRTADGSFGGILRGTYTPFGMPPHPEPEPAAAAAEDGSLPAGSVVAFVDADGNPIQDLIEARPDGRFAARWLGRGRLHTGVVEGFYAGNGEGEGRFRGRWLRACRDLPEAGIPDTALGCEGEDCAPALPDTANDGPRSAPASGAAL